MQLDWKYKIELDSDGVFEKMESALNEKIPEDLKRFVREHNAATPSAHKFMDGNSERVFGAVLDFNDKDTGTDLAIVAMKSVGDNTLLPFAIDPFGNYICLDLENQVVLFWDHETNDRTRVSETLDSFLDSLY